MRPFYTAELLLLPSVCAQFAVEKTISNFWTHKDKGSPFFWHKGTSFHEDNMPM